VALSMRPYTPFKRATQTRDRETLRRPGKVARDAEDHGRTRRGTLRQVLHGPRNSVITECLAAGVPLHAVSKLAGHSSTTVTERRYDDTPAESLARYIDPDWTAT